VLRPVLVVDDDAVSRHVLIHTLTVAGLVPASVNDADAAIEWLEENRPSLILLDLVMPGKDGYWILRHIQSHAKLSDVPVIVLTALDSDDEIQRIFAEGADDYVHKPFRPTELIARLRGQLKLREYVDQLSRRERNAQVTVELTQALAASLDIRPALSIVVNRLAELLQLDRCSIVLSSNDRDRAHVVVSSDNIQLRDFPLSLERYPEISHVLQHSEALIVPKILEHPLFLNFPYADQITFESSAVIPILHENNPYGVLFLRARHPIRLDVEELSLVRTVANTTAIAFSNAEVLRTLREATEQSASAMIEAEERMKHFRRYVDFFESAADGMLVVDRNGIVLFSNPCTYAITGYSDAELRGKRLEDVLFPLEKDRVASLFRGFRVGQFPIGVDFATHTKQGKRVVLSISSSGVLHEDNAVLLSFRDVTVEHQTAVALKQTKEFLESVIDSSADAIISTDMLGNVLLFNRAASHLFEYESYDVVGKLNVAELTHSRTARSVFRRLIAKHHGGWGRLKDFPLEVLTRSGQIVPSSLSASFIVEDGRPVGFVGVLTDLRERIRMERDLEAVQEELREREKLAIVAELAGTTAHELNQPLTSILGYSELIKRRLPKESTLINAANVIIGEAGRMAEIVRRIGKITRYETKTYVGEAKILDLDRASPESSKKPHPT
jgi:PAS domain S-box-containing protein